MRSHCHRSAQRALIDLVFHPDREAQPKPARPRARRLADDRQLVFNVPWGQRPFRLIPAAHDSVTAAPPPVESFSLD